MVQHVFEIPYTPKAIACIRSYSDENEGYDKGAPSLVFTHGAGGTLGSDGIANFSSGFASHLPIVCFQGNMNLKSRVKMFSEVMQNQHSATCLGGRSMGARAAVMAATSETEMLVLVSYPLRTDKEVRDQILLNLDPSVDVLFLEGDKDSMCDLSRLNEVRKKMKSKTWLAVVRGADHGMNVTPKSATAEVGMKTGEIAAEWIKERDSTRREGIIFWDQDLHWSGWNQEPVEKLEPDGPHSRQLKQSKRKPNTKKESPVKLEKRASKRRKISAYA